MIPKAKAEVGKPYFPYPAADKAADRAFAAPIEIRAGFVFFTLHERLLFDGVTHTGIFVRNKILPLHC